MWNRIKTLIIKELLAVWRDKRSRIVIILPPLIQLLLFSFAANLEVKNISIAVLNRDGGKASFELVQRFQGSRNFNKIYYLEKESQIKDMIDSQKAIMAMYIDNNFSREIESNQPAEVQLILDGRRSNAAQIVLGYASRIIEQYNRDQNSSIAEKTIPTKIVERNWFNPNLDYIRYTVPCLIGILTTTIGITVTALSVAREREFGTFDQLLVSPLSSTEILIGKTLPALIIGVMEGTIILTAAILVFRIPFVGSLLFLYLGMLIFLVSVIGVGMFISSLSMTQQQAILGAFVFLIPAIMLSGYATPYENMPLWLQKVMVINPLKYFLVIIKGVFLKDISFSVVLSNIIPMAIIATFNLTAAGWLFRKKLE